MAKENFETGTTLNCRVTFTDPDNSDAPTDPTTVSIAVRGPSDEAATTYTYGTDDEVVKEDTGDYLFRLALSEEGTYRWKWTGSTSTKSVAISEFCDAEGDI